jgi:hypothetical protein
MHVLGLSPNACPWPLGCLLLRPVVFPAYLARRKLWARRQEQAERFAAAEERARGQEEARPAPGGLRAIALAQRLGGFDPVYLAPNIPARLLRGALLGPLELEEGELLLAVIDPSLRMRPGRSRAVTTRRLVRCDPHRNDPSAPAAEGYRAAGASSGRAWPTPSSGTWGRSGMRATARSRPRWRSSRRPWRPRSPGRPSGSAPSIRPCATSTRPCGPGRPMSS